MRRDTLITFRLWMMNQGFEKKHLDVWRLYGIELSGSLLVKKLNQYKHFLKYG